MINNTIFLPVIYIMINFMQRKTLFFRWTRNKQKKWEWFLKGLPFLNKTMTNFTIWKKKVQYIPITPNWELSNSYRAKYPKILRQYCLDIAPTLNQTQNKRAKYSGFTWRCKDNTSLWHKQEKRKEYESKYSRELSYSWLKILTKF